MVIVLDRGVAVVSKNDAPLLSKGLEIGLEILRDGDLGDEWEESDVSILLIDLNILLEGRLLRR